MPSGLPTVFPSAVPSAVPSQSPTSAPEPAPTYQPSLSPSGRPSVTPSSFPSRPPSGHPSEAPTVLPSPAPTANPVPLPTPGCGSDSFVYRMRMRSATGGGWNGTVYAIQSVGDDSVLASGTLSSGASADDWVCLANGCYRVTVASTDASISFGFSDAFACDEAPCYETFCVDSGLVFAEPTLTPTMSNAPSLAPSVVPMPDPTQLPVPSPSYSPTFVPTRSPTGRPSPSPTALPSSLPLPVPSYAPSLQPTLSPTQVPSLAPTALPTAAPSIACTEGTSIYRLRMYDTGGNGWQGASYEVFNSTALSTLLEGSLVASGTLADGHEGSAWLCLRDGCYELHLSSGSAPSEIGFGFEDEVGGGFRDLSAPFSDHFCAESGVLVDHPTQSPTLSVEPSLLPSPGPSESPTPSPSMLLTDLPSAAPLSPSSFFPTRALDQTPSSMPLIRPTPKSSFAPSLVPQAISVQPSPLPSPWPTPETSTLLEYTCQARTAAVIHVALSALHFGNQEYKAFEYALSASVGIISNTSRVEVLHFSDFEARRRALLSFDVLVNYSIEIPLDYGTTVAEAAQFELDLRDAISDAFGIKNTSDASYFNDLLQAAAVQLNASALFGATVDSAASAVVLESSWGSRILVTAACECDGFELAYPSISPTSQSSQYDHLRSPSRTPTESYPNGSSRWTVNIVDINEPHDGWDTEGGELMLLTLTKNADLSCDQINVTLSRGSDSAQCRGAVSVRTESNSRLKVICRTPPGIGDEWDISLRCNIAYATGGSSIFHYAPPRVTAVSFPTTSSASA